MISGCVIFFISVTFGSGLKNIGSNIFSSTGLTEITIPSGVTSIDYGAFSHCSALKNVSLPIKKVVADQYMFYFTDFTYNVQLNDVTIPDGAAALAALYSKDGKLLALRPVLISPEGEAWTVFTVPEIINAKTNKLFIIQNGTMVPMAESGKLY